MSMVLTLYIRWIVSVVVYVYFYALCSDLTRDSSIFLPRHVMRFPSHILPVC